MKRRPLSKHWLLSASLILTIDKCHPQLYTHSSSRLAVRASGWIGMLHRSVGQTRRYREFGCSWRYANLNCGLYIPGKPPLSILSRPLIKQLNMDYDSLLLGIVKLEIALIVAWSWGIDGCSATADGDPCAILT